MIFEVLALNRMRELPAELAEKLDMPEDILYSAPKLSLVAGRRALIENHRGVLEYSPERIVVSLRRGKLCLSGTELWLKAMNGSELLVQGHIRSVEWE